MRFWPKKKWIEITNPKMQMRTTGWLYYDVTHRHHITNKIMSAKCFLCHSMWNGNTYIAAIPLPIDFIPQIRGPQSLNASTYNNMNFCTYMRMLCSIKTQLLYANFLPRSYSYINSSSYLYIYQGANKFIFASAVAEKS